MTGVDGCGTSRVRVVYELIHHLMYQPSVKSTQPVRSRTHKYVAIFTSVQENGGELYNHAPTRPQVRRPRLPNLRAGSHMD